MDKFKKVESLAKKYGASDFKTSTRKNKKYMVLYNGKWIHYGQKGYEDFLDHNDKKRRMNYRTRARGITDAKGRQTYKLKTSANFWAYHTLW